MSTILDATTLRIQRGEPAAPRCPGVRSSSVAVSAGHSHGGEPTGSLYYASHTHYADDVITGVHSHVGFEIFSFVLAGSTAHCEDFATEWETVGPGDLQYIRSGSGVVHREHIVAGTEVVRFWFDPGYAAATGATPREADYAADLFRTNHAHGRATTPIVGDGGPVVAQTPGLRISRVRTSVGQRCSLPVGPDSLVSIFVTGGFALIDGALLLPDDTAFVSGADAIDVDFGEYSDAFVVSVPNTTFARLTA